MSHSGEIFHISTGSVITCNVRRCGNSTVVRINNGDGTRVLLVKGDRRFGLEALCLNRKIGNPIDLISIVMCFTWMNFAAAFENM